MNILMVHPHDIYSDLEPWTVRITYLASELVKMGHTVRLIYHLRNTHKEPFVASKQQEFPFLTIPLPRHSPGLWKKFQMIAPHALWADVVHFQKCLPYASLPVIIAAFYHRRPVHYDWDDWEQAIYEQGSHNRLFNWAFFKQMERHLPRLVDTISVASEGLKELCIKTGFPVDRMFELPVGADLELFHPENDGSEVRQGYAPDGVLVIYQGQISGANYVHLFLRAIAHLAQERKDATFMVVGGGDRIDEAKALADELDLSDRLIFTGAVPHESIPRFLAAADVVVATFEENQQARCKSPLKIVEYMAAGKAIVASRVGEAKKMLDGCGVLVDPESATDLAAAIDNLLSDPERRRTMGHEARQRAEAVYNWRTGARTLQQALFTSLTVRHTGSPFSHAQPHS